VNPPKKKSNKTLFPLSSLLFLSYPPLFFPAHPSPSFPRFEAAPEIQLGGLKERCKLPKWVGPEPGRQTIFATLWSQQKAILLVQGLVCLIYLDHWHSKTTTADKT